MNSGYNEDEELDVRKYLKKFKEALSMSMIIYLHNTYAIKPKTMDLMAFYTTQ